MLPGVHQRGLAIPSLHLYFQERYHDDENVSLFSSSSQLTGIDLCMSMYPPPLLYLFAFIVDAPHAFATIETKLIYFEMFTLWIAPLQLDLDEEMVIRLIRYFQTVRNTFKR